MNEVGTMMTHAQHVRLMREELLLGYVAIWDGIKQRLHRKWDLEDRWWRDVEPGRWADDGGRVYE
jgi:hypothetical protein